MNAGKQWAYKLHRVATNSKGWTQPSSGRLGRKTEGKYVSENGFGHEDWNFSFASARDDGTMLGYTVARPSMKLANHRFGLVLATFDANVGWQAIGYYNGAAFEPRQNQSLAFLRQAALDVYEVVEANGGPQRYLGLTLGEVEKVIEREFIEHCWAVNAEDVHVFAPAVTIKASDFSPGRQRMSVSYDLDRRQFSRIIGSAVEGRPPADLELDEGSRKLRIHSAIERSGKAVAAFKSSLTSFACVVCGFDFERKYGKLGRGYIECHHTVPLAQRRLGEKTKLEDFIAVCSNCHSMLHRDSRLRTLEELRHSIQSGI